MNKLLKEIIKHKKTCYFISPHLDDAAFSAGGLISYLASKTKVVIVTAFTRAGKNNHSLSAVSYAKQCGYKASEIREFFATRRKEDRDTIEGLGAKTIHLSFKDALWRKKKKLNFAERITTLFINEFRYLYPTHRLHVSRGKINKKDEVNLKKLEKKLKEIVGSKNGSVVFCPLGIGKHVDHIAVREVCSRVFTNVIYWSDSPYNLYHQKDIDFIAQKGLKESIFNKNQSRRKNIFVSYKTQFKKLLKGKKDFKLLPEVYFLRKIS